MTRNIHGWQIAFLLFAVVFLCAPITKWAVLLLELPAAYQALADRSLHVFVVAMVVLIVPAIRRRAVEMLRVPIGPLRINEAVAVSALNPVFHFGIVGGFATWLFVSTGPEGVERMVSSSLPPGDEWARALSIPGVFFWIVVASLVGPVVEEIVFRGFLQGAWERRWGWFAAAFMTSLVFGLYHPHPAAAFTIGLVFSCLYRRTGSLRAAIGCHVVGNLSLWYPLMGQFLFPPRSMAMGDPGSWAIQLTCLVVLVLFLPAYVIVAAARPAGEPQPTEILHQPA